MLRERRDSQKDSGPPLPRTCPSVPPRHMERPRIGSTKSARAGTQLHWPALIKDSLQTGASHWADFWNGFLIPRDTSRAEGDSCSIDQWAIDSASGLTSCLAPGKSRLGLGPSRLRYWIIDRRSPWCKGRANHSLSSIKMKWKPSLKPTLAR